VPNLKRGMLFKIKKYLLPALIACGKHLKKEVFEREVFNVFVEFSADGIWGVRKVCIEKLADIMRLVKDDTPKRVSLLNFLSKSLNDQNKWVKTAAYSVFGEVIYEASSASSV